MNIKEIEGAPFGYEFTQPEFAVIGRNLRTFGHAAISAEIRANSPNTAFGRKVNLNAVAHHERTRRIPMAAQFAETGLIADTLYRLRLERYQTRALLESRAPIDKAAHSNVLLGMFTTKVAFEELQDPILTGSSELHEPSMLIDMRNMFVIGSSKL